MTRWAIKRNKQTDQKFIIECSQYADPSHGEEQSNHARNAPRRNPPSWLDGTRLPRLNDATFRGGFST